VRMGFTVTKDCSSQMHVEAACHLGLAADGSISPSWRTEHGEITVDGTWNCGVLILLLLIDGLASDADVKTYEYVETMVRNNNESVRLYTRFLRSLQAAAGGRAVQPPDSDLFSNGMWNLSGANLIRAHAPAFTLMANGATHAEMRRRATELLQPGSGQDAALLAIDTYFHDTATLLDPYSTTPGWLEYKDGTFPPLLGFTKSLHEAAVKSGTLAFFQGAFSPTRTLRRAHFETDLA
jgi:hypothetical protein